MVAALQAPIIMMSQNRQWQKDRLTAQHDYEVNLKAELEIMALHEKFDQMRSDQLAQMLAKHEEQIKLLTQLVEAQEGRRLRRWPTIRLEGPSDAAAADAIVAERFGPGRFAKTAYRLREGVACVAALSFVAEEAGRIVGTVRYWPVEIGGEAALMLGPIAIVADRQGQGIALALMQTSLAAAQAARPSRRGAGGG